MNDTQHVYAVLLAGGGGTRLWPKSRNKTPKQFLKLTGKDTMVQVAGSRVTKVIDWSRVIVVTNQMYLEDIKTQLPQVPVQNILAEPEKRDTALAMLVGALYAKSLDPDAVVMNGASDHVIVDETEFVHVMEGAIEIAAKKESLVTVGITPTRPDTAFGYIKIGQQINKIAHGLAVFTVDSFTEKPNMATAQAFLSTGKYFWNANMYVWSATALQDAFAKYMPEMYELTKHLPTLSPAEFQAAIPDVYAKAQSISIDYAISEKATNLVLIPGDFGWNDVGDWKVVFELGKKDLAGNVVVGDEDISRTITIGAQNNLIHTDKRLVALVGVNDMIVIDTGEILLVMPQSKSQDVKKVVERLKEEGKKEYL